MDESERSTHEQHKREAFDGMRAYHNSEIAHTSNVLGILKTILTTTILVFGGFIGLIVSQKLDRCAVAIADLGLTCAAVFAVVYIALITCKKIDRDHKRYEDFRSEWIDERNILEIDQEFSKQGFSLRWSKDDDRGDSGFRHTKRVVWAFGVVNIAVAIIGAVAALLV